MSVTIKVYDKEVMAIINSEMTRRLDVVATEIKKQAKENAPVVTGDLRRSIERTVDKNSASVGTDIFYAKFVEFGTKKQSPQYFLTRAVLDNIQYIKNIMSKKIQ